MIIALSFLPLIAVIVGTCLALRPVNRRIRELRGAKEIVLTPPPEQWPESVWDLDGECNCDTTWCRLDHALGCTVQSICDRHEAGMTEEATR